MLSLSTLGFGQHWATFFVLSHSQRFCQKSFKSSLLVCSHSSLYYVSNETWKAELYRLGDSQSKSQVLPDVAVVIHTWHCVSPESACQQASSLRLCNPRQAARWVCLHVCLLSVSGPFEKGRNPVSGAYSVVKEDIWKLMFQLLQFWCAWSSHCHTESISVVSFRQLELSCKIRLLSEAVVSVCKRQSLYNLCGLNLRESKFALLKFTMFFPYALQYFANSHVSLFPFCVHLLLSQWGKKQIK